MKLECILESIKPFVNHLHKVFYKLNGYIKTNS